MDPGARRDRVGEYRRLCGQLGRRCTLQRRVILEATLDLDDHPTADRVHEVVAQRIPGIARTTVYRTLDELTRMGVIAKACHPGQATRYDARTDPHHHLVCLRCNAVIDIVDRGLDAVSAPDTSAHGFEVTQVQVQLRGVCHRCRGAAGREESR